MAVLAHAEVTCLRFRSTDFGRFLKVCAETLGNSLSWLRRVAIPRLKRHLLKESLRGKMPIVGWNDNFLAENPAGQHH